MSAGPVKREWPEIPHLPVAWGEVFDKLTILQIKLRRLGSEAQLANVQRECREIERVVGDIARFPGGLPQLLSELQGENERLWELEEGTRACERLQSFDARFVALAREIYRGNDRRAAIKRRINQLLGSTLVEEKSHLPY